MNDSTKYSCLLLLIANCLYINPNPDFSRFNAHDSGSYLALSYSLVHNQDYTRNISRSNNTEYIPHTTWPPGIPLLLAPAVAISGDYQISWPLVKATMILTSLLGLWLVRQYSKRLFNNNVTYANFTMLAIGLNPLYWHFSRIGLAEAPVVVFLFAALLLSDLTWARHAPSFIQIFATGLLLGLGMMIKGTILGTALLPLAYFRGERKTTLPDRIFFKSFAIYLFAFCIPYCSWSYRNHGINRQGLGLDGLNQIDMILRETTEDPDSRFRSPSELTTQAKRNLLWNGIYHLPSHIIPMAHMVNLHEYSNGNWFALTISLGLSGFIFIKWRNVQPVLLTSIPMVLLILPMTIGGSERYWFPISILFLLALTHLILKTWPLVSPCLVSKNSRKSIVACAIGILILNLITYAIPTIMNPFGEKENYQQLAKLIENIRDDSSLIRELENAEIFTKHPTAFRLSTGISSPMHNEALAISPRYTHAIVRYSTQEKSARPFAIRKSVDPWHLIEFEKPVDASDIKQLVIKIND